MSDTRTGQERRREVAIRNDSSELTEVGGRRVVRRHEVALAMPPVAIGRFAVIRFYAEDYLGDNSSRRPTKDNRKRVTYERD
jgi:hypothetical protein